MNTHVSENNDVLPALVTCGLFFVSGSAALVYEVLWMKELSLLFGNSAQAAAATLAAFFIGIAAGNAYWGRRAAALSRPLMTYGVLELCVTLSAVLYFTIYLAYDSLYPLIFGAFNNSPFLFTLSKFLLSLLLFFPAAFFMGGTLPVMTEHLVRNPRSLGKRASLLYAINTLGAATGAFVAGFYLPQALGIDTSYLLAMAATLVVGIVAIALGRTRKYRNKKDSQKVATQPLPQNHQTFGGSILTVIAALSGFAALALQVLWIRMFAQVLHNSVYTYSAILAVFLVALAIGGAIARQFAKRDIAAVWLLPTLLTIAAAAVAASPLAFNSLTNGNAYVGANADFLAYMIHIVWLTTVVVGIPTVMIGTVLPYLFKLSETQSAGPGATVGRLLTINTIGAIIGSIVAGFLLLELIGLYASIKAIASLYLIVAIAIILLPPKQSFAAKLLPLVAFLLLFTLLDTSKLPVVRIDSNNDRETLLQVWEGSDATVAVIKRGGHLRTKLNNWYTLGGTGDMATQQIQSHLPLQLHPNPKRIFYLGLGTGITAGTSLDYKVDEVTIAEIAPSAIRASAEYFGDYTNGLYQDPRVSVIADDGRNVLRGLDSQYDLIISDLFIPWKAGTGTLYSVEHYATAKRRLDVDGMYAQWLPLYQMTSAEFAIVARSMLEVFPTVSIWRGNFSGERSVVALIGHKTAARLADSSILLATSKFALQARLTNNADTVPLIAHYAGTLNANDPLLVSAQLNTDARPIIEYLAPINHRLEKANKANWFLGKEFFDYVAPKLHETSLQNDPYLFGIAPAWFDVIQAGYYLQASLLLRDQKQEDARIARSAFNALLERASTSITSENR